jgi:hypothetical protein
MRKQKDESYQAWVDKVRLFEYGVALQRIANGENVDDVMESMSKKISQKLLHPLIESIKESHPNNYDPLISKESYKKNYLDKTNPTADHMNDVVNNA